MKVDLIRVPYDSGQRLQRMGAGPDRLLEQGLAGHLETLGHRTAVVDIELAGGFHTEVTAVAELARQIGGAVSRARAAERFPLVLSGNCSSSLGTIAGVGSNTGVVWFDAHGDFNTPETTRSGFFDGQALAVLTGRCWTALAETIPGFQALDDRAVALIGARDLDANEADLLALSCVTRVDPGLAALDAALSRIADHADGVYLHIDLDVLDSAEVRVNQYAAPNGLSVDRLLEAVSRIGAALPVRAAAFTAYDPDIDPDNHVCAVARRLAEAVLNAARATTLAGEPA